MARQTQPFAQFGSCGQLVTLPPMGPCEAPLVPFSIRPYRRCPAQCSVTYNAGLFQVQGTVWDLSCTGWRLSGDLPMRPGEILSLTVTLPNEHRIEVPAAVVRWSRGQNSGSRISSRAAHSRSTPALCEAPGTGTREDHCIRDQRLMSLRSSIALVLSLTCVAAPAWADYSAGEEAYYRGDYATAFRELNPLAANGDARAEYLLGLMYVKGEGVPQDFKQAEYWWFLAAEQGHAQAQYNLGAMYANGLESRWISNKPCVGIAWRPNKEKPRPKPILGCCTQRGRASPWI